MLSNREETDVVEWRWVGAWRGAGHFHLDGGHQRVLRGAASPLSFPPVLAQAASQQELFSRGFVFTGKTQQGVL